MTPPGKEFTLDRVVRMVLTAIGAVALFFLLRYLSGVLLPFAAAAVLAYLLNPLVRAFQSKVKSRGLAVGLTLFGVTLAGLAVVVIVVPLIVMQVQRFERSLGRLRTDLAASYSTTSEGEVGPPQDHSGASTNEEPAEEKSGPPAGNVPEAQADAGAEDAAAADDDAKSVIGWTELSESWRVYREGAEAGKPRSERIAELYQAISGTFIGDQVDDLIAFTESERFRELVVNALTSVAAGGLSVLGFFFNFVLWLIGLVIVLLYLVFLLIDYPEYSRNWPNLIPPAYREATVEFYREFNDAMGKYFRGQAVISLITGAVLALGFTIIGLPMAVPFGLATGALNMVPYLQAVAIVPALMLGVLAAIEADAGLLWTIGEVLLVFGVAQIMVDWFLTPRIMGQATGLRPVVILLGIFIWGKLLGFLGILLAIPLTCLAITYYRRYVLHTTEAQGVLAKAPAKGGAKGERGSTRS